MKKLTSWYSVYVQYADARRIELMKFQDKKAANAYAKKCARQSPGMSFDVCHVRTVETFVKNT